jgi:5-oxoprolinase (ATP-hydrolysing)
VREVQFRRANLLVSILSERRATRPYGAAGGEDGARGRNLLLRAAENQGGSGADARAPLLSLGGKASLVVGAGDILRIETPGGGGWGHAGDGAEAVGFEGGSEQGFVPRASGSLKTKEELESDF